MCAAEAASERVLSIARVALEQAGPLLLVCVEAKDGRVLDLVARLRAILLSSARLSDGGVRIYQCWLAVLAVWDYWCSIALAKTAESCT